MAKYRLIQDFTDLIPSGALAIVFRKGDIIEGEFIKGDSTPNGVAPPRADSVLTSTSGTTPSFGVATRNVSMYYLEPVLDAVSTSSANVSTSTSTVQSSDKTFQYVVMAGLGIILTIGALKLFKIF
jgi:hypothetical protein